MFNSRFLNLKNWLQQITRFLNQAIQNDEDALDNIAALAKETLLLQIHELPQQFMIRFTKQQLAIDTIATTIDVDNNYRTMHIHGPAKAFITLLVTKDPSLAQQAGLEFNEPTNEQVLQQLQQLIFNLDLDWEEYLSHITGDLIAGEIADLFSKVKLEFNFATTNFADMLSEYILEEVRLCPNRLELDDFCQAVDELRSQEAQLNIAITNLKHEKNSSSKVI